MSGLTRALGSFIADSASGPSTASAYPQATLGFLDCIAAMMAGNREPVARTLASVHTEREGPAAVFLGQWRASPATAALLNGTAAHALDFDDVAFQAHPSAVLVPAILALAEAEGAEGARLLDAYVVGYEVLGSLARREKGALHMKGWHPTGVWGAVAAAAAAARLLKLDAAQATMALGLGASQSAGLMANFGTMAKPFHAGAAARAGVLAAQLARAGFTTAADAIEHDQGLLVAVSERGDTDRTSLWAPAQRWILETEGLSIKKFPTCYGTHRAIDAALALRASHAPEPTDIATIEVETNRRYATILRNHQPVTGLEAKFSMEFAVATALIRGRVTLAELTDAGVLEPQVQSLMRRISIDASQGPTSSPGSFERITVTARDGTTIRSEPVELALGHFARPLDAQAMGQKFRQCAEAGGLGHRAESVYAAIEGLAGDRAGSWQAALTSAVPEVASTTVES